MHVAQYCHFAGTVHAVFKYAMTAWRQTSGECPMDLRGFALIVEELGCFDTYFTATMPQKLYHLKNTSQ